MNKLEVMKQSISKGAGRTGLLIKKHSPEILLGLGIVGAVGSAVIACKATLKVEGVIDQASSQLNDIKTVLENRADYTEEYTDTDAKKDRAVVYASTAVELIKLYGPAFSLGALSVTAILSSHNIMKSRNVAVMAAYTAAEKSFADYRQRVVDEFGKGKDRQFRYGLLEEEIDEEVVDEKGKVKYQAKKVETLDPNHVSQYAKFFDESSDNWSKTPEYNMMFLKAQQNYANDLLKSRGHVFLNEVYDMIGVPRTKAGAIVGWVLNEDGDNFIDFGMYNDFYDKTRDFVNGYESSILLDFNVDGVIYDLI